MRRWYWRYFGISRRDAGVPPAVSITASDRTRCPAPSCSSRRGPTPIGRGRRRHRPGESGTTCALTCAWSRSRCPSSPGSTSWRGGRTRLAPGGERNPSGGLARGTLGLPSAVDQYQSMMDIRTCVMHPSVRENPSPLQTCMPWCGASLTGADPEPGSQPPGGEGAARRPQRRAGARRSGPEG